MSESLEEKAKALVKKWRERAQENWDDCSRGGRVAAQTLEECIKELEQAMNEGNNHEAVNRAAVGEE